MVRARVRGVGGLVEALTFLKEFVKQPDRIGAIVPSSPALAKKVVDAARIRPGHVVVELGPGTGPITSQLVKRHPDCHLLALEPTAPLARRLRERFPTLEVIEAYADRSLPEVVEAWGHAPVDRVISGLPWTLWDQDQQDEVFRGITTAMAHDGKFLTYTYVNAQLSAAGRRFRDSMQAWFGSVHRTKVLWANVPPAVVMVGEGPRRQPIR